MYGWRLAKAKYQVLDGEGARLYGGRWNSRGNPVVYLAGSVSLALLELLVHTDLDIMPSDILLLKIEIPDNAMVEELNPVPKNWRQIPAPPACQKAGDDWIISGRSAVLSVPSIVIPEERNYLLNPRHPDSGRIIIIEKNQFSFDPRLFGRSP
ncbi:MAG: RES family NAD+ phosphorylase [Candidatus Kapaibacterium sp.]